jgi:hypothetical protein
MKSSILVLLFVFYTADSFGQETPEIQLRFPAHFQILLEDESSKKAHFGLAEWNILPNTNAKIGPLSTLHVAGLLWKRNSSWSEFMAGTRINQDGYVDPIVNFRGFYNFSKVGISAEIQQSFRKDRRRFLWWITADMPTGIWKLKLGVETENINFWDKSDSWGIGPRAVVPISIPLPSFMKISVATVYHFRSDKDFVRVYTITTFQLPRKK